MSTPAKEPAETPLTWEAICALAAKGRFDGFHVDTDEWGRIVMTPVTFTHGALAARLAQLLGEHLPEGVVVVEVGVRTRKGVKAPDVMWTSHERAAARQTEFDDPLAGEICADVLSPANRPREIDEKRRLYFEQQAREVWTCDPDGQLRFWTGPDDEVPESGLAPGFPTLIEL